VVFHIVSIPFKMQERDLADSLIFEKHCKAGYEIEICCKVSRKYNFRWKNVDVWIKNVYL